MLVIPFQPSPASPAPSPSPPVLASWPLRMLRSSLAVSPRTSYDTTVLESEGRTIDGRYKSGYELEGGRNEKERTRCSNALILARATH